VRIDLIEQEKRQRKRRRSHLTPRQARPTFGFEIAVARPRRQARPSPAKKARPQVKRRPKADVIPGRRPIRWSKVTLKVLAFLILVGSIGLIAYGFTAPDFYVYQAAVSGAHHLSAEQLYLAAGIHEQSIFWVRPARVEQSLGQINGIKSVKVSCSLPARVRIAVTEREPVVMWRLRMQNKDWWLDEEGEVLPYHGDVNNTVFVVDSSTPHLQEGDRIKPEGAVASILQLAAALPGVNVFYYQADQGFSFIHKSADGIQQWPVLVGTSEDLSHKIQILQKLTEYLAAHSIQPRYIDVRWADHPVYGAPDGQKTGQGG
jgi:POTRA domain, FtsQ-type